MKAIAAWLAFTASNAFAFIDKPWNEESSIGGGATIFELLLIPLFFYGIYWFMTRFKNETEGFFWLMGGIFALMIATGISNCTG
jgi:hypothetical protein